MGLQPLTILQIRLSVAPGLVLCLITGSAAVFSSSFWGVPSLILALFLGYVVGDLARENPLYEGVEFSRQSVLKLGVVLLGVRLDLAQVLELGWVPIGLVILAIPLTILAAWIIGLWLRLPTESWLIGGAAVAICGASAAMAVAAILSDRTATSRILPYIVASVTGIGSIAMIAYPLLVGFLDLDSQSAGLLIGISIHDVAQVAGAGYTVSEITGSVSVYTKMLRVASLVPVIFIIALWCRPTSAKDTRFPGFLYAFAAVVALNALSLIPPQVKLAVNSFSELCLVTAMVGLGVKTQFFQLMQEGWRPLILLIVLSLFLLGAPLVAITTLNTF